MENIAYDTKKRKYRFLVVGPESRALEDGEEEVDV